MIKKECEKILNFDLKFLEEASFDYPPVSYTHLTLPTNKTV